MPVSSLIVDWLMTLTFTCTFALLVRQTTDWLRIYGRRAVEHLAL